MHLLDWLIVLAYIVWVVVDGLRRAKGTDRMDGYFVANRSLPLTVLIICVPMIVYTSFGGVQAVAWTDVKQMFIIVSGMVAAVTILVLGIPRDVGLVTALHLAGATGRLRALDFGFNLR